MGLHRAELGNEGVHYLLTDWRVALAVRFEIQVVFFVVEGVAIRVDQVVSAVIVMAGYCMSQCSSS